MIDRIVSRLEMKREIAMILDHLSGGPKQPVPDA
jgi:acetyl-CoA carboxylase beta subunit